MVVGSVRSVRPMRPMRPMGPVRSVRPMRPTMIMWSVVVIGPGVVVAMVVVVTWGHFNVKEPLANFESALVECFQLPPNV